MGGMSVLLSLLLLRDPMHLALYFVLTSVLTVIVLVLRILVSSRRVSSEKISPRNSGAIEKWKIVLLISLLLAVFILSVRLLAFLDAVAWFIGLNSLACSFSLSEVGLFLFCR